MFWAIDRSLHRAAVPAGTNGPARSLPIATREVATARSPRMVTGRENLGNDDRHTKSADQKLEEAPARDRSAIDAGSRARAALIHEIIRADGETELHRPASALLLSGRSEEHTSEVQSLMRISYAVFCLKKKKED